MEPEPRLARARRLTDEYVGDQGHEAFFKMDGSHLEALGVDIVRTMERGVEIRAAQAKADQVARQLDQAIASTLDERQQLRMLDEEIARVQLERRPVQDAASTSEAELVMLASAPGAAPADASKLRQLDGQIADLNAEREQEIAALVREVEARIAAQRPRNQNDRLLLLDQDECAQEVDRTAGARRRTCSRRNTFHSDRVQVP